MSGAIGQMHNLMTTSSTNDGRGLVHNKLPESLTRRGSFDGPGKVLIAATNDAEGSGVGNGS